MNVHELSVSPIPTSLHVSWPRRYGVPGATTHDTQVCIQQLGISVWRQDDKQPRKERTASYRPTAKGRGSTAAPARSRRGSITRLKISCTVLLLQHGASAKLCSSCTRARTIRIRLSYRSGAEILEKLLVGPHGAVAGKRRPGLRQGDPHLCLGRAAGRRFGRPRSSQPPRPPPPPPPPQRSPDGTKR
jgi:hypothetical protein